MEGRILLREGDDIEGMGIVIRNEGSCLRIFLVFQLELSAGGERGSS